MRHPGIRVFASLIALGMSLGCVSTNHQGHREAMRSVGTQPFAMPVRQQVYLFLLNGSDWFDVTGLGDLETGCTQAGYSKVYVAPGEDVAWYRREIARIHRDEPVARFVLFAQGRSAKPAYELACDSLRQGIPLDSLLFLEPLGLEGNLRDELPITTVTIRSHRRGATVSLLTSEEIELPGFGWQSLVRHPEVLPVVLDHLNRSASRVRLENISTTLPALPLHPYAKPLPRPIDTSRLGSEPGYEFLPPMPASISPPKPVKPKED